MDVVHCSLGPGRALQKELLVKFRFMYSTCMFHADVQEFLGLVMHETYMYMYIGT